MADLSEVMTALVTLVSGAVYPNGTAAPSIVGLPVMCYPGWPVPNQLNADIAAGKAHVSVFPRQDERNTTRAPLEWKEVSNDGTTGTSIKEIRRQERTFQITIWAPTPAARDMIAKVVDPVLAVTSRFTLPDQTSARLIYKGSPITDMLEKSKIYRRDLLYSVEYATTVTETGYAIKENIVNTTLSAV